MVKADYYILIGGGETGPWTRGQVQAFWRTGAVTLETLYAKPEMSEWKPLSAILDVTSSVAPTPTPQPENFHADEQRKVIETIVNVMLPLENTPAVLEADDTMDEPVESEKVDVARMRQWLQDKLAAIGFAPETEKSAADEGKFSNWLCFSGDDQKVIFGANNIHRYRKGDLTWQGLIGELEHLAISGTETFKGDAEQFTPENAAWIMDIVEQAENPTFDYDTSFAKRMGEESGKRAAQITLERRKQEIAEALAMQSANVTSIPESKPTKFLKSDTEEKEAEFLAQTGVPIVKMVASHQEEKNQPKAGKWINGEGRLVSVEEIASEWYQSRGYNVLRCEGTFISVWVGTFLAHAIQDPHDPQVRRGFRSSTRDWTPQRRDAPLISILLPDDFSSTGYYERRENAIQASIQRMRSAENLKILFDELLGGGESLRDYLWVNTDEAVESSRAVLNILPREMIISCVDWAIKEFWQRRSGWPDLFVWSASGFTFSEVKSPHDKLSQGQMHWFKWAIHEAHIPCELCHVEQK